MDPGPLAVGQIVENVPGFVDLTPLDARGPTERMVHGAAERFRAIENHQHRPVGAQPATLQITQQSLANRRIFRRSVPQPERVFLARRIDAERDHETVLGEEDAVDEDRDQIQRLKRGGLGRQSPDFG